MAGQDELVSNLKNVVLNLSQLVQAMQAQTAAINAVFPQQTGTAATATAGSATLPANPVGFIIVTLPGGSTVKVPYYDQ
jgi:Holliday junction resolvasome RuvABC endonuclease subunit